MLFADMLTGPFLWFDRVRLVQRQDVSGDLTSDFPAHRCVLHVSVKNSNDNGRDPGSESGVLFDPVGLEPSNPYFNAPALSGDSGSPSLPVLAPLEALTMGVLMPLSVSISTLCLMSP
jgi:hypothetical protein